MQGNGVQAFFSADRLSADLHCATFSNTAFAARGMPRTATRKTRTLITSLLLALCVYLPAFAYAAPQSADKLPPVIATPQLLPDARCADRLQEEDNTENADVAPLPRRLPSLTYQCTDINGRAVLIGEAGREHERSVLLVHGLGNRAHRDWHKVIPVLATQFHVITVDLPGFGSSEALAGGYAFDSLGAVLDAVLARHAADRVHVVGHSLGGAVSLYFAHRYPQRVDRLVLVDAAGILLKSVFADHITQLQLSGNGNNASNGATAPLDRFLARLDDKLNRARSAVMRWPESQFDFSRWLMENPGLRNTLLGRYTQVDAAMGLVEHDFTRAIRETQASTTVIWGAEDRVAPLRTGQLLAARLPDARLQVLPGIGHVPMNDAADLFNSLLLNALQAPGTPRFVAPLNTQQHGDVVCNKETHRIYSGEFRSLKLRNCLNVRIENARIGQLISEKSRVDIVHSEIVSPAIAVDSRDSELRFTASRIQGNTALRVRNSTLDLAGVQLQASEHGAEILDDSRLYFSVSQWHSPEYQGDVHQVLPAQR